ncbi:MAG: nickel-dependent lactate racemase [Chloroflexota bacterium]
MIVTLPYGSGNIDVSIDEGNVLGVLEARPGEADDEASVVRRAVKHPVDSQPLPEFLPGGQDVLVLVNDATRPTPTAKVLQAVQEWTDPGATRFIVATGAHRAPTDEEYRQIFGPLWHSVQTSVHVHDCRRESDMVHMGTTHRGTPIRLNRMVPDSQKVVIIGSVEPHYFAGYTGGRKSFLPGVAAHESIEQNHRLSLDPNAESLRLAGNPVHEDMVDAMAMVRSIPVFSIMTVLDREQNISAATAGNIESSFAAATGIAEEMFTVRVSRRADIVVSAARFPMDIDLYQSQKALESGKLALKEGGILILVSKCRCGVGADTFLKLMRAYPKAERVLEEVRRHFVLGYQKAAKLAELASWAELYAVTDLPATIADDLGMKSFSSVQEALDTALRVKGPQAEVLFLPDGSVTVPRVAGE